MHGISRTGLRRLARILFLGFVFSSIIVVSSPLLSAAQGQGTPVVLNPPTNLVASALDGLRVNLSWTTASVGQEGYQIQRATDRTFSRDLTTSSAPASATTFNDQVRPATVYYYRVKAFSALIESDWSNMAIVLTPNLVPQGPTGLSALSSQAYQANLVWQDNSDNEAGFRIERATDSNFTSNLAVFLTAANVSNCFDNTVPAGNYYYRVLAFNRTADSSYSNVANVTVGNKLEPGPVLVAFDTATVALSQLGPAFIQVDRLGVVQTSSVTLSFGDHKGFIDIAKSTAMLNADKQALVKLNYSSPSLIPQAPAGKVMLDSFELGPSFSTFSPSITMTVTYEPGAIPTGQEAKDLEIGFWDGAAWQMIADPIVNMDLTQIKFSISHFCTYALFRPEIKPPPPFTISNLHVFPEAVNLGEDVLIWTEVTNNGPDPGNYTLVLKIDGKLQETRSISLDVQEKATVNFKLTDQPAGTYKIDLNGLAGSLMVRPQPVIRTNTTASPRSSSSATTTAQATSPLPSYIPPEDISLPPNVPSTFLGGNFNLLLGALVFIVAVSLFLIWKRGR